jgi:peptidoglycan L-alanyl-D-glutamate endopeptidase CwlK
MPAFGSNSLNVLKNVEPELVKVLEQAIEKVDFSVVWGHRDMEAQNTAFNEGKSQLRWPKSKHNANPSIAVDIIPYPSGWVDLDKFNEMATYVLEAASQQGVRLRWGGHWKNYTGQGEDDRDWAHFEMMR